MDQRHAESQWIAAYLEWTHAASGASDFQSVDPVPAVNGEDAAQFASAYFEWTDARRIESAPRRAPDIGAARPPNGELAVPSATREAILLAALRAESDCVRFLRRVLDAGEASPRAVGLACEAIECAETLLQDERLLAAHAS
jgi:hypothetical protein